MKLKNEIRRNCTEQFSFKKKEYFIAERKGIY